MALPKGEREAFIKEMLGQEDVDGLEEGMKEDSENE